MITNKIGNSTKLIKCNYIVTSSPTRVVRLERLEVILGRGFEVEPVVISVVLLELKVVFLAVIAEGVVFVKVEVVVAETTFVVELLACIRVGAVEVSREGLCCKDFDVLELAKALHCFVYICFVHVGGTREYSFKEGVGGEEYLEDIRGFLVNGSHGGFLFDYFAFYRFNEDEVLVFLLSFDLGGFVGWRGGGAWVFDALTIVVEHESAGEAFSFSMVETAMGAASFLEAFVPVFDVV